MDAAPQTLQQVANTAGDQLSYSARFFRKHGWKMLLWFFCLLLPMWGCAAMIEVLHEKGSFPFDTPILNLLHSMATPAKDKFFVMMSKLGYLWGVLPLDVIVFLWLIVRRRFRDTLFFTLSVVGSLILNVAAKNHFARARPSLWLSITPETTYSFPSGHAMASATLAVALILLFWPTRWRWFVTVVAVASALLIGLSRAYLGVHYPSDILTGWVASIAWVVGMHELVIRKAPVPPPTAAQSKDTTVPDVEKQVAKA
jgi:undecaprenyl-diphosphatase